MKLLPPWRDKGLQNISLSLMIVLIAVVVMLVFHPNSQAGAPFIVFA